MTSSQSTQPVLTATWRQTLFSGTTLAQSHGLAVLY